MAEKNEAVVDQVAATPEPVPAKQCIAWGCQEVIGPGKVGRHFCQPHWDGIPEHMRVAVTKDQAWLKAHGGQLMDPYLRQLIEVAANRELQLRLAEQPKERARFLAWSKVEEAKLRDAAVIQSARAAGLVLPESLTAEQVQKFGEAPKP